MLTQKNCKRKQPKPQLYFDHPADYVMVNSDLGLYVYDAYDDHNWFAYFCEVCYANWAHEAEGKVWHFFAEAFNDAYDHISKYHITN